MDNITKAALLLNAIKAKNKIFTRLCSDYDPCDLWQSDSLLKELGLTEKMTGRLLKFISDDWAEQEDDKLYKFGARFIHSSSNDYPSRLLDLSNPPVGLYVKGNVNLLLPFIAIVGTRKCSLYAENTAVNLGRAVAEAGMMTISGGAKGIDTAGHRGTLLGGGVTSVIFGNGLDRVYPVENRDLFAMILEHGGAWVSEYPFGTNGDAWRFPERDRLIAGIAAHVVIAESPEDGGAMYTAKIARKLGRDTWSIPGRITDATNLGSNRIMNDGVKTLADIGDFIKSITSGHVQLNINFNGTEESESEKASVSLDENEKTVYSFLQRSGAKTKDSIAAGIELDDSDIDIALMNLEADGLIISRGGRYEVVA